MSRRRFVRRRFVCGSWSLIVWLRSVGHWLVVVVHWLRIFGSLVGWWRIIGLDTVVHWLRPADSLVGTPQVGMRWLRESWLIGWDVVTQVDGSEQIVVVHWLGSGFSMVGKSRLFGQGSGPVEVVAH